MVSIGDQIRMATAGYDAEDVTDEKLEACLLEGPASMKLEEQLRLIVAAMRQFAADRDEADYYEAVARDMLDRRPLMLVGLIHESSTRLWVMEPGTDIAQEGMLEASLHHLEASDGTLRHFIPKIGIEHKDYLWGQIDDLLGWVERSQSGEFLTDITRTGPLPACVTGEED